MTGIRAALRKPAVAEFTLRAVATGVLLGVTFGAANAYLGLRVGMTISASIPATVLTIALFRLLRIKGTLLEANMAKTVASASTSLPPVPSSPFPPCSSGASPRPSCRWWRCASWAACSASWR